MTSPGIDRILTKKRDFERFVGKQIKVSMQTAIDGRKRFKGVLSAVENDSIVVEIEGDDQEQVHLLLDDIDKAKLVPDWGL